MSSTEIIDVESSLPIKELIKSIAAGLMPLDEYKFLELASDMGVRFCTSESHAMRVREALDRLASEILNLLGFVDSAENLGAVADVICDAYPNVNEYLIETTDQGDE